MTSVLDHTVMDHDFKHWLYGDVSTEGRRDFLPVTTSIWTTPWWTGDQIICKWIMYIAEGDQTPFRRWV